MKDSKSQICFGHFEIAGFEMDRGNVCETGIDKSTLSKYDVVFECAGAIESFNAAQVIARRGGSIVVLGLTPEKSFVDFNPFQLVIKELRIQGSFLNPLTQRRAANLIDSKKLKLDPLISRVLTLDEVPEILNKPPADGDIKYIVKP
jgi:L-iditol 2-dehydrogenase